MKTSSISRRICEIRCRWPTGNGGAPGSVMSMRSDRRRVSSSPAASCAARASISAVERLARRVGRAADGAALLDRQRRDAAQKLGQLGLAPEVGDPHLLQGGAVGCRRDRRALLRLAAARCGPERSLRGHPSHLIQRHCRGHRRVQRIARRPAECGAPHGSVRARPAAARRARRRQAASRCPRTGPRAARRRRARARRSAPAAPRETRSGRSSHAKIAPIDARTAFGP